MSSTLPASKPIPKWPFFVGDGLFLVATIAILSMAERPLSGSVAAAAVVCLVLGIGLAIAPFLIDHESRLQEAEHSGEGLGVAQIRKIAGMADQLNHTVSRSQSSSEQIEKALAGAEESNDRLAALIENLTPDPAGTSDQDKAMARIQEALTTLQSAVRMLSDSIERMAAQGPEKPVDVSGPMGELKQQIADLAAEIHIAAPPTPTPSPEPVPVPVPPAAVPVQSAPLTGESDTPGPTPAEPVDEPEAPEPATEEALLIPEDETKDPDEDTPRFVFNEHSTSVIATAYIGIGNKLFLRGDGPGLSWDKGVPMQFLSIGKWGWSALEITEPITCRIYRNDDEPAIDGDIELQPMELIEISPRF